MRAGRRHRRVGRPRCDRWRITSSARRDANRQPGGGTYSPARPRRMRGDRRRRRSGSSRRNLGRNPGPDGTRIVIRRRVGPDDLVRGLTAIAVKSDDRITVYVSQAIPDRLQRAGGRSALRAARRAGWTRNPVPAALLLFAGLSLWRAAFASGARRFAVAGFAALILATIIGAFVTGPAHSLPGRAVITPVTPSSTPHVRVATKQAAHSQQHAQTRRPGRARVVAHRQPHGASTPTVTAAPTEATPTGASPRPDPSPSPDPRPTSSPTKTRHCIILLIC